MPPAPFALDHLNRAHRHTHTWSIVDVWKGHFLLCDLAGATASRRMQWNWRPVCRGWCATRVTQTQGKRSPNSHVQALSEFVSLQGLVSRWHDGCSQDGSVPSAWTCVYWFNIVPSYNHLRLLMSPTGVCAYAAACVCLCVIQIATFESWLSLCKDHLDNHAFF